MQNQLVDQKIRQFIVRNIGTHTYITQMNAVKGTNRFNAALGVSLPKTIIDDEAKKQYIDFLKFDDVYNLEFEINNAGRITAVYNLKILYDNIEKKEMRLKYAISNIILDEIYPNLMSIDLVKNNLRPIYVILNDIFTNKVLSDETIRRDPKKDRLVRYVKFLLDYGIIRQNSKGDYVQGNIPIGLKEALKNKAEQEVLRYTFGYVLKDGRKYLKEELHLYMLDVFVSIITAYYYLSMKVKRIIKVKFDTFLDDYTETYQKTKTHPSKFLSYLKDLVTAGVLSHERSYYYGDADILKKILAKQSTSVV